MAILRVATYSEDLQERGPYPAAAFVQLAIGARPVFFPCWLDSFSGNADLGAVVEDFVGFGGVREDAAETERPGWWGEDVPVWGEEVGSYFVRHCCRKLELLF